MFKADKKILAEGLKIALGKQSVPETVAGNEKLFSVLNAMGIAQARKGEIKVFNSKNMLGGENDVSLSKEDIERWNSADIDFSFNVRMKGSPDLPVHVEKLPGDSVATVTDTPEHVLGCLKLVQDSRSPWILVEGDKRPFYLQFVNKRTPADDGNCSYCSGWQILKSERGRTVRYGGIYAASSFSKIVSRCLTSIIGYRRDESSRVLNNGERMRFVRSTAFSRDIGDNIIEIVKEKNSPKGEILLGGDSVGSITLGDSVAFGLYKATIKFHGEKMSVDSIDVQNAVWNLLSAGKTVAISEPPKA